MFVVKNRVTKSCVGLPFFSPLIEMAVADVAAVVNDKKAENMLNGVDMPNMDLLLIGEVDLKNGSVKGSKKIIKCLVDLKEAENV